MGWDSVIEQPAYKEETVSKEDFAAGFNQRITLDTLNLFILCEGVFFETAHLRRFFLLRDSYVTLGQDFVLAGQEDALMSGRASSEALLKDAERNRFIIVAYHQPVEAEENTVQGVDLEVAGHTHAGQIFPVGCFTEWFVGLNSSASSLQALCSDSTEWMEGKRFGSGASKETIEEWLRDIGLKL